MTTTMTMIEHAGRFTKTLDDTCNQLKIDQFTVATTLDEMHRCVDKLTNDVSQKVFVPSAQRHLASQQLNM